MTDLTKSVDDSVESYIKKNISKFNLLDEKERKKILGWLKLTPAERKKYMNQLRWTPFSFKLSLGQNSVDSFQAFIHHNMPSLSSTLKIEQMYEDRRQQKIKAANDRQRKRVLSHEYGNYQTPGLKEAFAEVVPSFSNFATFVSFLPEFGHHEWARYMGKFEKWTKETGSDLVCEIIEHILGGADGPLSWFLDALAKYANHHRNCDPWDLQCPNCPLDDENDNTNKKLGVLIDKLIPTYLPEDLSMSREKISKILWQYFQQKRVSVRQGGGDWGLWGRYYYAIRQMDYDLRRSTDVAEMRKKIEKHTALVEAALENDDDW